MNHHVLHLPAARVVGLFAGEGVPHARQVQAVPADREGHEDDPGSLRVALPRPEEPRGGARTRSLAAPLACARRRAVIKDYECCLVSACVVVQVYHEMVVLEHLHTRSEFSIGTTVEAISKPALELH